MSMTFIYNDPRFRDMPLTCVKSWPNKRAVALTTPECLWIMWLDENGRPVIEQVMRDDLSINDVITVPKGC